MADLARPNLDIPLTFPGDTKPPELKRDLERLANAFKLLADSLRERFVPRPGFSPMVERGDAAASFDVIFRVRPAQSSSDVNVFLPKPDTKNAGREIKILRMSSSGGETVRLVPIGGALINNATTLNLGSSVGLYRATFDGEDYWMENT